MRPDAKAYSGARGLVENMIRIAAVSLLLCSLLPPDAARAAPQAVRPLDLDALGAPAFTAFSARDGLPETVTVDVRTDGEGFVWAASPAGVFRYDGHRFAAVDDPAMAHFVDSLWVDDAGTLWVAFRSDGLAHHDGSRWQVEDLSTGLPSQQIRRFAETRDRAGRSTLWAITWDRGLLLRRDGRWQADPDNGSLPPGALLSMAQTVELGGARRQWVGTGTEGLWYRDEGRAGWQRHSIPGVDSAQVEFLLAARHQGREVLWISVFGAGLLRLDADGLRRFDAGDGLLPTHDVYDMAATRGANGDSVIWVSSRAGLLRIQGDRVRVFDRRHGLPSNAVRGLSAWRSPDGHDVIWLATEAGVARTVLGANPWSTASLLGARSTGVFAVMIEPDEHGGERLWVGGRDDGLARYADGRWRPFGPDDGLPAGASVSLIERLVHRDGRVERLLGLAGGELLRIADDDGLQRIDTPWDKSSGEWVMDALLTHRAGRDALWVGTRLSGIWRLQAGVWRHFRPEAVHGQWRISQLLAQRDAQGREWLWAATNQGLARHDGRDWQLLGGDIGLPDTYLLGVSLFDDPDGRPVLWLGSVSAGIVRVDVSDPLDPRVLDADLPAPPDRTSYGVQRDAQGRLYNCTNNGVQQLAPGAQGFRSRVFTRRDGMVHDECNSTAQLIDAHGRFWTGTLGGLAVYDPRRDAPRGAPKPLRLTGLRIDEEPVNGQALTVPPTAKTLRVDFALLAWHREGESRFRSQLIGYEAAPGAWSDEPSRSFGTLPPGRYRLHVEAVDHAGTASVPLDIPITVVPHWWQTGWARTALVMSLLLLGYALSWLRTRQLGRRQLALEARVAARTAELNAANARLVTLSYHDALTGLANRRRLFERLEAAVDAGSPAPLALVLIDVDHFKALNDRHGHVAGDVVLSRVAHVLQAHAGSALVARYGGEEFACVLPDTGSTAAAVIAERLRAAVAACPIAVPESPATLRVTVSAGVASLVLRRLADVDRLLREADEALYQAKRDGRDRVCQAPAGGEPEAGPDTDLASTAPLA